MTIDDIKEYVEHELDMNSKYGHPTVDEIRVEAVDLMKAGGLSPMKAMLNFERIKDLFGLKDAYINLVPQYDEFSATDYQMLSAGEKTFPNLLIDEDTYNGIWTVYQASEFEDEVTLIGKISVAYEGVRFLRNYDGDEANMALASLLINSEDSWCTC